MTKHHAPKAADQMDDLIIETNRLLKVLSSKMQEKRQKFESTGSKNWGLVGDMEHIRHQLAVLVGEEG